MAKRKWKIVPFEKKQGLVPAADVEAARRAFEKPGREITVSELFTYYEKSAAVPVAQMLESKALIPLIEAKLPSLLVKYNTLEESRRRRGFDKTRAQIEAGIKEMLSYPDGLARLREAQKKYDVDYMTAAMIREYFKRDLDSEDERFDLATSLTTEEITWASVITKIPLEVFQHKLASVPAIVDKFYDGLEWGVDSLSLKDNPEMPIDTFNMLGLTGVRHDTTFTPFMAKMVAALQGLYLGWIADSYIFERCIKDLGSSALMSGDGKLLRAIAHRAGKVLDDRFALDNRQQVTDLLNSIRAIYVVERELWTGEKLVKMIGLLESVPACLFDRKKIAFLACGKGVMFLDPTTLEEIEYVPFDPYVSHIAENEIHYSAQSIDRANPIWNFIFANVSAWIEEKNRKAGHISRLEATAEEIRKNYGVEVLLGVQKRAQDRFISAIVSVTTDLTYTTKIGYWDLFNINAAFSNLPKWHLEGVKSVSRSSCGNVAEEMATGMRHRGSYIRASRSLEIYAPGASDPDSDEDADDQSLGIDPVLYIYTITHEVGHAVCAENAWVAQEWKNISNARFRFPKAKRASQFLTSYASTSPDEDFADHYACYCLFPVEFRAKAAVYPEIARKYDFMKKVFDDRVFEKSISELPIAFFRGPLAFDYALRRRLVEKDAKGLAKDAISFEAIMRSERDTEAARRKPVKGPRIHSLDTIDDPSKRKKADPRELIEENHFEVVKVIRTIFNKAFHPLGHLTDALFASLRLASGDIDSVVMDVSNSLGWPKKDVLPVIEKCAVHIKKLIGDIGAATDQSEIVEEEESNEDSASDED